ncbi:hypothetical protein RHGRI_028092 [Rhododendron griersonianum]|uniref:Uncharacterized protein n=1 Tax=Rhododendron griersonianum TaxID=479676 RepID=A0AAV6IEI7_9ERIC|nr:hypothetical protein RHGRI_028092 [Rhododendron griersonianum]
MSLWFLSAPPSPSLTTCHASPAAVRAPLAPPPPPQQLSFPPNANPTTPLPSLTCALQCPHFQSCSGCTQEFNLHRPTVLDEATDFFKKHGVSDFSFDTCRLLAVRGSSTDPLIGLYEEGTHNAVDIPECKVHHPNINVAVELLKKGAFLVLRITELNIEPYDEDQGTGELRYVKMAVTTYDTSLPAAERYKNGYYLSKVQVTLVWNSRSENSPSSEKLNALANFVWRYGGPSKKVHLIHSVWANFQTSPKSIIFGNRWRHLLGERDFWEHVGGIDVSLAPSSFGQANTRAFDSLLQKLQKYVPVGASVADLYAGAGVIGLSLAVTRKCRQGLSVKCIEVNKESKLSFEKTVDRIPNSIDCSISWHCADTSIVSVRHLIAPLSWLWGSDIVVVDPPRKGMDPSLLNTLRAIPSLEKKAKPPGSPLLKEKDEKRPWILRAKEASVQIQSKTTQEDSQLLPKTLIYISRGWNSFKEDCMSLLSSKAWVLDKAHGFNFFPGTEREFRELEMAVIQAWLHLSWRICLDVKTDRLCFNDVKTVTDFNDTPSQKGCREVSSMVKGKERENGEGSEGIDEYCYRMSKNGGQDTDSPPQKMRISKTNENWLGLPSTNSRVSGPSNVEPQDADYTYIPSLNLELQNLILARMPRSEYWKLCFVNRRYLSILKSGELFKIRREIGIKEPSLFMGALGENSWWEFDHEFKTKRKLPIFQTDISFLYGDRESFSAGAHLLVSGKELDGLVVWRYELAMNRWYKGPSMISPRCLFASATCGTFAFVAGGIGKEPNSEVYDTAEKYNPESKSWDPLPQMNKRRQLCAGCYMDDRFYVIGGRNKDGELTCGEFFDKVQNKWVLIPDMWKDDPVLSSHSPPLVAVVNNELYSLEISSNQLKVYEKSSNTWKPLGLVPVRADISRGWSVGFKSLGDELLVRGLAASFGAGPAGNRVAYSCCPDPDAGVLKWNLLHDRKISQVTQFIINSSLCKRKKLKQTTDPTCQRSFSSDTVQSKTTCEESQLLPKT